MLTLILTRHAKSSWDDPLLYDHDRPLTTSGVKSARAIGRWMVGQGYEPDVILTSSATRAQMTAELIAEEVQFKRDFLVESALYHASSDTMLKHLRRADGVCVLMVGHNPGIADFAGRLPATPPDHPQFFDYPTAATLVASSPEPSWHGLKFGEMTTRDFVLPRALMDAENPA